MHKFHKNGGGETQVPTNRSNYSFFPAAKGFQHFAKEIMEFFTPRSLRTSPDNSGKIENVTEKLEEWTDSYFGHLFLPGSQSKMVAGVVSRVYWTCPTYSLDSLEFKTTCCMGILVNMMTSWMASSKLNTLDNEARQRRKEVILQFLVSTLSKFSQDGKISTEGLKFESNLSIMDLLRNEPTPTAVYDAAMCVLDMVKDIRTDFDETKVYTKALQDYVRSYARKFEGQSGPSPLEGFILFISTLEGLQLPENVGADEDFMKWSQVARQLSAAQSNGEEDKWREYAAFKECLLHKFEDDKVLQRWIDVTDSWLYGNIQACNQDQKASN